LVPVKVAFAELKYPLSATPHWSKEAFMPDLNNASASPPNPKTAASALSKYISATGNITCGISLPSVYFPSIGSARFENKL
jgi:hypothetical protein